MPIQSSGTLSLSDLRAEFIGGSDPISFQDLYKGSAGGNAPIRAKAANNTAIDLAPNVPSSGSISFNNFYGAEKAYQKTYSGNASSQDMSSVFGDDYTGDYKKRVIVNSGVTISGENSVKYPSGGGGEFFITNNGNIRCDGGVSILNQSAINVSVTNNGTISAGTVDAFNSTFDGNGSARVYFSTGGQGGASGPDIRHTDYGGNFQCKVTRSGNTFTASWTYNELDYRSIGSGSINISSIFPLNADGTLNANDTNDYVINSNAGSRGRDTRDIAFGSKIINGVREIWFCSNNKSSLLELGSLMRYLQYGWRTRYVDVSNSRRSDFFLNKSGSISSGLVTGI